MRLGKALEFVYQVAGKRSLTAGLQLRSGFQVAGTDKILLMKDRGRDGRILIGRADDSHIRVPHDEAEVEVYSASDGQVRVRFQGQGKIAGRPFRGEHPVAVGTGSDDLAAVADIQEFCRAIQQQRSAVVSGADWLAAAKIAEAVSESIASGSAVSIAGGRPS